uniref:MFS domain-containing protein n=1 Tax=Caenorhabditis japonica TaxID=281687 RepID=A0A8R1DX14_CAEJA
MSSRSWKFKQLAIFALISFSANFNYGFSTTYINTSVDEFKNFLNESLARRQVVMTEGTYDLIWNIFLNCWFVGFFVGIWLSPILNEKFGRKYGFLLGNLTAFISSVLQCASILFFCPELLVISRFITSICMAVTYQSCILFLQECSPTHLRGNFSFLSEISYSFMTMVGSFLGQDYVLGSHLFWLCFSIVPFCLFFTIVLIFLPETPKFLLLTKDDEKSAEQSVKYYHGDEADAKQVLETIRKEAECESKEKSSTVTKMKEMFTERHLRMALILSVSALQNTIGLWALLLSSTFFLESVNVRTEVSQWSTTVMSLAYVAGTLTGGMVIERAGRRTLILLFTFLNNVSLLAFVLFAKLQVLVDPMKYGCLISLIIYGYTYGTGVGPISWFISSEMVPQTHRSIVQSVGYAINTLMVVISTFTILPLYSVIGSYAFLILYSIPSFISMLILFRWLPETRGREIHEIVNELKSK